MREDQKAWIKKNLFSIISIILTIGILLFFMLTEEGIRNLRHVLFRLQPVWLLWIIVGVLAGWLLEGFVLHLFCRHIYKQWRFGQSFYVGMVGLFYSALTPFSIGEPMEIYNMTKMGMDTGSAGSIIAVKSLVHHAVTFFYSLVLISFELNYFQTKVSNFSFITIFGLITNSIFIILVLLFMLNEKVTNSLLLFLVRFLNKIRLKKLAQKISSKVYEQLQIFHESSRKIGRAYILYSAAILLTLVQVTIASLISYFVYRSFGMKGESVFIMVAADTFVTMVASFIPLPGSSGGAEGGFYLFFREFFGDSIIPGITLWRVATYYLNILFGGIVTYWGGKYTDKKKTGITPENTD
jgi:conserved hypothetical protein